LAFKLGTAFAEFSSSMLKIVKTNKTVIESLEKIVGHLEEEARMILPGIQALFGFQLIAVFNQRFTDLSTTDQVIHLIATLGTALAVMLVLMPAAYHRQAEPDRISEEFCQMSSRLLAWSMLPLAFGIALDLYVIGQLIFHDAEISTLMAVILFLLLMTAWFIFPQMRKSGSSFRE
jgi:hypothetical protein